MPVLNKYHGNIPKDAIYIGRGDVWGNPYIVNNITTREQAIELHRQWLWGRIKKGLVSLESLAELHEKPLVCFCKPHACHGDTLLRAAKWAHKQLNK